MESQNTVNQKKKVGFSFNAGGIRGYFSALIIQQLEKDIGMPLNQFVDVFSGVSIGCILSTMYAIGISSDEIVNMFETKSEQIFKPKYYYRFGIIPVKGPRYCTDSLKQVLSLYVQDMKLKDVKVTLLGLVTDITDPSDVKGKIMSNMYSDQLEMTLLDMILASSAAPSYFQQHQIDDKYYIDGGVSNCIPALQCFLGLSRQTNNVINESILVQIGTCSYQGNSKNHNKSTWNSYYLMDGLNASMQCNSYLTTTTTQQLYYNKEGDQNQFLLDINIDQDIQLDDITALPYLKQLAQQTIDSSTYRDCLAKLKANFNSQQLVPSLDDLTLNHEFEVKVTECAGIQQEQSIDIEQINVHSSQVTETKTAYCHINCEEDEQTGLLDLIDYINQCDDIQHYYADIDKQS